LSAFSAATQTYQQSRLLVELIRDLTETDDQLLWLREDLVEAAMDLKLAVIDGDRDRTETNLAECRNLITAILTRLHELGGESEE
jgi:hypothetical protein